MNYYIGEHLTESRTAGSKARDDISAILKSHGWEPLTIRHVFADPTIRDTRSAFFKVRENLKIRKEWSGLFKTPGAGDTVLIQFPVMRRPALLSKILHRFRKRGGRIILVIHDLELFRYVKRKESGSLRRIWITYEEKSVLQEADHIIVHNEKMRETMIRMGTDPKKMIPLRIFDYLAEAKKENKNQETAHDVAIAGYLAPHKAGYLYQLPSNVQFSLYGRGYEDKGETNIRYYGSFHPDELPFVINAKYGLVWDGDSADTCTGIYGEYLKINNPHKTSLYLAAGIPVIIWSQAAMGDFIREKRCGLTVDSLSELREKIDGISPEEYQSMKGHAESVGDQIRKGEYTLKALSKAV